MRHHPGHTVRPLKNIGLLPLPFRMPCPDPARFAWAEHLRRSWSTLSIAAIAFVAGGLASVRVLTQSELVIYKEGTKFYHRPGCRVIRDSEGVVAMTRAQAESRGFKPHPDCDRPEVTETDPAAVQKTPRGNEVPTPAVTVYLDGSKYYHRKDCPRLKNAGESVQAQSLEVAGKRYWPCPDCRPPIRRKSAGPAVPGMQRRGR
jgi:hypothetical protein